MGKYKESCFCCTFRGINVKGNKICVLTGKETEEDNTCDQFRYDSELIKELSDG